MEIACRWVRGNLNAAIHANAIGCSIGSDGEVIAIAHIVEFSHINGRILKIINP